MLGLIILASIGCASNPSASQRQGAAAPLPGTEACIFTVNLYDWTVLGDSTLIVYAPLHRDAYLLKLFSPMIDLPFRQALGFEDVEHNGQLCKGDYVVARGEIPLRTPISSVRLLTPAEAKQLIAASKQPAPHSQPGAATQPDSAKQ